MKTPDVTCSFCRKLYPGAEAQGRIVAGPTVFICRDCVDICVQVFMEDPDWREAKIRQLTEKRDA